MNVRLFSFVVAVAFAAVGSLLVLISPTAPTAKAQSAESAILLTTQGTLSASGQYSQTDGTFFRFVEGTPTPTPSPTPTPTCEPVPGAPGGTLYLGTYTLSNGEEGSFVLTVPDGGNSAAGSGAPEEFPDNPVVIEQGPAIISLQIDQMAGTGTGTISFTSNGTPISGIITIDLKFPYPPTDPVGCDQTPTPTPTPSPTPTPTPTVSPSPSPSPPTSVELSGRVLHPTNGRGISGASVYLFQGGNQVQRVFTSASGFFVLSGIPPGTYSVSVTSKRFRFNPMNDVAFTANRSDLEFFGVE